MIKIFKCILVFAGLALAGSCEEYLGTVDCSECFDYKPDSADLVIQLTIDNEHPAVPIILYRGNVEDNKVDWIDTARESPFYIYSRVDQLYSIKAEYKVEDKTIFVFDGDDMKVKHVSDACTYECWLVTGGILNAELKFE